MEKKKVLVFVNSSGENVIYENLEDTFTSINYNINVDFSFYVTTDKVEHKKKILEIAKNNNFEKNILEINVNDLSWSENFNNFFINYSGVCDYVLVSHDDVKVRTFDFFNITMSEITGYENEIGWIGFTSDNHYTKLNAMVCQSAREIFTIDRKQWPKNFELHKMPNYFDEKLLDYPVRACKVPGIFSHFNLIKSENLEKIGLCENWGVYTVLIDEDWSLQTLVKNMWTVWVPSVFYDHPLRYDKRKISGLKDAGHANSCFYQKWGFNYQNEITDEIVKKVCDKFSNTNISYFNDKNSFDYQYLKN